MARNQDSRIVGDDHISEEQMELYALGRLQEPLLAELEEHLLLCELCQVRLEEFDAFASAIQEACRQTDAPPSADRQQRENGWFRLMPLWAAGGAAAAALLVFYSIPERTPAQPPLRVELRAIRSSPAETTPTALAGRPLLLRMEAAGLADPDPPDVKLVDGSGRLVWSGKTARQQGAFIAAVPPVGPGQYWVRLAAPDGGLLREYGLQVEEQQGPL